jgi:hypothetical protein
MGNFNFKADGFTPILGREDNLAELTESQREEAQMYLDQLAIQTKYVKKDDWSYIHSRKDENGNVYLTCCFESIGPHCEGYLDIPFNGGFDLKRQEAEIRKWVPKVPNLTMNVDWAADLYCVRFPLTGNKNT